MSLWDDIVQAGSDVSAAVGVTDVYDSIVAGVENAAGTFVDGQVANASSSAINVAQVAAQGSPAPANPKLPSPTAIKTGSGVLIVVALIGAYFLFFKKGK